jgi:hypothetical protein
MKSRSIILIILVVVSIQCATDKSGPDDIVRFDTYLRSLDKIDTPFKYNTREGLGRRSENYDSVLFARYKHIGSVAPHGKLGQSDSLIKTIEVIIGDIVVPVLMIYNRNGVKIDSLNPLDKAGGDIGYSSDEYVTMTSASSL